MTSDLIELARHTRDDMLGNFDGEHDHWAELLSKLIAEIERLAALSQPQHGGLVEALGLEWSEDGYSLRTPYDGDVDGEGRHVVVGGETVITFADSSEGDKAREAFRAALASNSPVVGEDGCFCERMKAEGYREVCGWCISNKDWSRKPTPAEQPTPTDTADRREAVARAVLDKICAAMCKAIGAVAIDPDPWVRELAADIASLIAVPQFGKEVD